MKHRVEPLMKQRYLLLVGVGVVGVVLQEVVEPLAILIHMPRTLLQVQELLKLANHQACRDVVSTEGLADLSPQHLVVILKSGGKISPPSTGGPMKLQGHVHSLLELGIVQQPKLGLDDAKPIICLKWISRLGEQWWVCCQEVGVGGVHHRLVVWLAHSTMHEVLHQHLHELILCG
jgi:hypothetical protein